MVLVKIKWNNTRENFAQGLITIGNSYIERKDCSCYYKLILVLGYLPILKCKPIKCKLLPFYIIPEERPAESSSKLFRNLKLPGNEPFEIWGFICLESEERGFHSLGGRGCLWIKHQTQLPRGLAERGLFPPFAWSLILWGHQGPGAIRQLTASTQASWCQRPDCWLTDIHKAVLTIKDASRVCLGVILKSAALWCVRKYPECSCEIMREWGSCASS